jgi:hypothetical protein
VEVRFLEEIIVCHRKLPLLALVFSMAIAFAAPAGPAFATTEALPDFRLLDTAGQAHRLHRYVDAKAVVIMAVPAEGVEAERVAAFAGLSRQYTREGGRFLLVSAGDVADDVVAHADEVPVLLDDVQVILPALGLLHAYDCVVAESTSWRVLYRGGLDGAPVGLAVALATFLAGDLTRIDAASCGPALALEPLPQKVDYAEDIAPVLGRRCVTCHSDGNIAPFAMDSHKRVAGWAAMMAETVRNGRMPPWRPDPAYGQFSNDMALTRAEKRTLLAWLDAGARKAGEDDPLVLVEAPTPSAWRLGTPDVVVNLPEPQAIPAEGVLEYKYYEVPMPVPAGTWLRGTELRIPNPEVVHHILVYMRHPGDDFDFTQEYIASYVPGHAAQLFPEGTGTLVPEKASLLFQLHYTPNGRALVDEPALGLYLHATPPAHEIHLGSAVSRDFAIPATAVAYKTRAHFTAEDDILVYALAPHMHYRGRRMSFEAVYPTGAREMLLSVPDYDFYWQHTYQLAEPKRLPKGTVIEVAGAFDNSVRNPINPDPTKRLIWGDQSTDEMFIGSVLYRAAE